MPGVFDSWVHGDLGRVQLQIASSTLSLPRVINFPCSLTRNITSQSMMNLAFHSLLPILTTLHIHFSFKGWENVLFELGIERVKVNVSVRIHWNTMSTGLDPEWDWDWERVISLLRPASIKSRAIYLSRLNVVDSSESVRYGSSTNWSKPVCFYSLLCVNS